MTASLFRWLCYTPLKWLKQSLGLEKEENLAVTPDFDDHDHALFKNHTEFRPYATSHARYAKIRTLYHPHTHSGKLKAIADLPLLVVLHGVGGALIQFAPLLGSLVSIAPVFGIELPGHGISEFSPKNYEAYTFEALTELWKVAIEDACKHYGHDKIVLIGHSLGCSLSAKLASIMATVETTAQVVGIVAICPKATPPTGAQVSRYRRLLTLPDFVLDILRWFDRRGNENSASVRRFVGESAGLDLKRFQLRLNQKFSTPVWKRVSIGLLPHYQADDQPTGGMPGQIIWEKIKVPLLLIAGEADAVTQPKEAASIVSFFRDDSQQNSTSSDHRSSDHASIGTTTSRADEQIYGINPSTTEEKTKHASVVRFITLPAPASHALLYDHSTYRTAAGLVESFLARHISEQLSLGWQLQKLTTSGKWDVKNLQKWKKVVPVSGAIDGGLFRALKTLREQDETHTPSVFLSKWADIIYAVIDISHDSPVYDTKALERGGVQYHKFATVSKIPPTVVEVSAFIELVDRLRSEIEGKYTEHAFRPGIAVHCHYGYNRTGFFIVCYLIEKRGYAVHDAIEEFAKAKPPGIKHDHFIDTLFVRYCVGLRRSSTFR